METISVSSLKAHLSAELKKVKKGARITVLEHKRPVAVISPIEEEPWLIREAQRPFEYRELSPLSNVDPLSELEKERAERW
ncbi:MAG: type II toxin-antitoxin system Phd/YefM family antitoxin [Spirochaetia bacterium]